MYTGDEPNIGMKNYDEAVTELIEEYTMRRNGKKGQRGHGCVKELMELTKPRKFLQD